MIKIEYTGLTDTGLVRQANEDNLGFFESPYAQILTVCDGMGGHVGGSTASAIAVNSILEHLSKSELNSPEIEINNAIVFANHAILQAASENPQLKNMGTTCTVLVIKSNSIHIGHVGDSRIYLLSKNRLHRITKDHSFVQNLIDAGAILDEEAENHPRKNELTKALGVRNIVEPTISKHPIKPQTGDIFMLCSDGLCGLVSDRNLEEILNRNSSIEIAANHLIMAAKNAGGHDNITVQLAKVVESNFTKSEFVDYSPREQLSSTLIEESLVRNSNKNENFLTKTNIILLSIIACLLILVSIYFFTKSNYDSQINEVITEKEPKISAPDVQIEYYGEESGTMTLNCKDTEQDGFLVHTAKKDEAYTGIKLNHQQIEIYKNKYDFNIAFDKENKPIKNLDKINEGQVIKWKEKLTNKLNPPKTKEKININTNSKTTTPVVKNPSIPVPQKNIENVKEDGKDKTTLPETSKNSTSPTPESVPPPVNFNNSIY